MTPMEASRNPLQVWQRLQADTLKKFKFTLRSRDLGAPVALEMATASNDNVIAQSLIQERQ